MLHNQNLTIVMRATTRRLLGECDHDARAAGLAWLTESEWCEHAGEYRLAERAAVFAFRIVSGMNHHEDLPLIEAYKHREPPTPLRVAVASGGG